MKLVCRCRYEIPTKVMKSVTSSSTPSSSPHNIAPPPVISYQYDPRGKEKGSTLLMRSESQKLDFIFPITFHRKPSFLDLNSPHFSNTLLIYQRSEMADYLCTKPALSFSFSFSFFTFTSSLLTPTSLSPTSLLYTTLLLYSITSTMPSITSFLWSLVGLNTSKRVVRLPSLPSLPLPTLG